MNLSRFAVTGALISSILLAGCARDVKKNSVDPYEKYNRKVFRFNMDLNEAVLKPVVNTYDTVLPSPVRDGVHNFFGNVMMIPAIGNDALQANFRYMFRDIGRFAINTTFGLFGLVDVASSIGLQPRTQSFGLTLAKWGIRRSPYVMIPLLGPSTVRGTFGLVGDYYANPITYVRPDRNYFIVRGVQLVQNASDVLPHEELIQSFAIDPYVAVRNAYLQNRNYLVKKIINETPDNPLSKTHRDDNLASG